jgi:hypothetical protein
MTRVPKMKKKPMATGSIVACIDKHDGAIFKAAAVSHMIVPALADPFHVVFGAGCGEWGVCVYLTLADAARLNAELGHLINEHTQRG